MNLKQHLIDGDPVAREPELGGFHADAMRQRMLAEAVIEPTAPVLWWLRPIAVAGALVACLIAAIGIGLRINTGDVSPTYVARPFQGRGQPPRQLQFASPGGTRIIWTFHQEFDL
jgi:hypothetical protein